MCNEYNIVQLMSELFEVSACGTATTMIFHVDSSLEHSNTSDVHKTRDLGLYRITNSDVTCTKSIVRFLKKE